MLSLGVIVLATTHVVSSEPPRAIYEKLPAREAPTLRSTFLPPRRVIYMNRNGGYYWMNRKVNVPPLNESTIYGTSGTIPPFSGGDDAWAQIMGCVRLAYAPFNVEITDVEPPADWRYIESVVGGYPEDVGLPWYVGGVGALDCDRVVETAIVFTFAEAWSNDPVGVCETATQEIGHAFSLLHEMECWDPMTYLDGCHPKAFQDKFAPCGEYGARACDCGRGYSQNSYRMLLDASASYDPEPPTARITFPGDGDTVTQGFVVQGEGADNRDVSHGELFIDGAFVISGAGLRYFLDTPPDLVPGTHTLELRVYDDAGSVASDTIDVVVVPACAVDTDCGTDEECVGGACLAALGAYCRFHDDCSSQLCWEKSCTSACTPGESDCPSGFSCDEVGLNHYCKPDQGMFSCALGRPRTVPLAVVGWLTGLLLVGWLSSRVTPSSRR